MTLDTAAIINAMDQFFGDPKGLREKALELMEKHGLELVSPEAGDKFIPRKHLSVNRVVDVFRATVVRTISPGLVKQGDLTAIYPAMVEATEPSDPYDIDDEDL